jgi:hypothetical protein
VLILLLMPIRILTNTFQTAELSMTLVELVLIILIELHPFFLFPLYLEISRLPCKIFFFFYYTGVEYWTLTSSQLSEDQNILSYLL